ncbi:MAG: glycosyltransferase family 2 protein [Geminicoccaceae bacterium]
MDQLTVTLITVVRNGGTAFERAARSVGAQSYRPLEYIVIDGGSTDGTVDVIRSFDDYITHWTSEPDRGISHAFNKGIAASTGCYICFVNADDWLEPDYVEQAVHALEIRNADFVFGNLAYHAADGTLLHVIEGDPHYAASVQSLMPALNHPTMLVRRAIFDGIGGFDERYKVAMDYDWVLRAHLAGYRGRHVPEIRGHMTLEGISDRRFLEGLKEVRTIAIHHGQRTTRAWLLFAYRTIKGMVQRVMQRHAPSSLHGSLRGWVNPAYRMATSGVRSPSESGTSHS